VFDRELGLHDLYDVIAMGIVEESLLWTSQVSAGWAGFRDCSGLVNGALYVHQFCSMRQSIALLTGCWRYWRSVRFVVPTAFAGITVLPKHKSSKTNIERRKRSRVWATDST
jgi:hypothetical protein